MDYYSIWSNHWWFASYHSDIDEFESRLENTLPNNPTILPVN